MTTDKSKPGCTWVKKKTGNQCKNRPANQVWIVGTRRPGKRIYLCKAHSNIVSREKKLRNPKFRNWKRPAPQRKKPVTRNRMAHNVPF